MKTALIVPPLVLGVGLAISNWRLIVENRRLNESAQYYASLRHTRVGVELPDLRGKDLDGRDLTISYGAAGPETLLFVFSPTCPHCKRNWPVWSDLAKAAKGQRVVFANVGPPIPPDFANVYGFGPAEVMAQTDADSILKYSLFEFPITLLVSPEGRSEKVWVGELSGEDASTIKRILARDGAAAHVVTEPRVHDNQ